jgi:hypothetical protein
MNPRVIQVECHSDHSMVVTFNNGERRRFDIRPYLVYPVFQSLREMSYFLRGRADHGTVCWPNEEDFCPDTLYLESHSLEATQV